MEGLDTGEGYAVRDIGLAEEGSLESIGLVQEYLFLLHFEEKRLNAQNRLLECVSLDVST